MKLLVVIGVLCLLANANAQVRCRNAGSLDIPASPCCDQVSGQGLANAVSQFFDMMDVACMVDIFFDAVITDPEVTAFFNYITGPEFRALILSVQNMQETKDFMNYICKNMQLDVYLYLNTLGDILGIPRMPHPEGDHCHPEFPMPWDIQPKSYPVSHPKAKPQPFNVGGMRGLMDMLYDEIPSDEIYDLWLHLIATDPYLCPAFLKFSGPDFRAIALKMEFHPEFMRFVQKLEEWNIEMYQFMDDLKDFLWYSDYCR